MKMAISQGGMVALVREILNGQDLSKITAKIVRVKVIEALGKQAGDDITAIKASVKSALSIVLNGQDEEPGVGERSVPGKSEAAAKKKATKVHTTEGDGKEVAKEGAKNVEQKPKSIESKELIADATEKAYDPDVEDNDGKGSYSSHENDDASKQPQRPKKRRRTVATVSSEEDEDNIGTSDAKPNNNLEISEDDGSSASPERRAPRKKRSVAGSRSRAPPKPVTGPKLQRLKKLCGRLGLNPPRPRVRGKTEAELCAQILEFLRSKGVKSENPWRLSKHEVEAHKERIAHEKELEGLDARCVLYHTFSHQRFGLIYIMCSC